jgi:hypothetical protein
MELENEKWKWKEEIQSVGMRTVYQGPGKELRRKPK